MYGSFPDRHHCQFCASTWTCFLKAFPPIYLELTIGFHSYVVRTWFEHVTVKGMQILRDACVYHVGTIPNLPPPDYLLVFPSCQPVCVFQALGFRSQGKYHPTLTWGWELLCVVVMTLGSLSSAPFLYQGNNTFNKTKAYYIILLSLTSLWQF
jgi:hypothetical protein